MISGFTADRVECWAVEGVGEAHLGDDLGSMLRPALEAAGGLRPWDIVVVTHKIVSKAEGRVVPLEEVRPGAEARALAARVQADPRLVEVILGESRRVVRAGPGVLVTETRHGLVCANAGVDRSNVGGGEVVTCLPVDPDGSAARLRRAWLPLVGAGPLGVMICDTFGRPFREGGVNVAVGLAGLPGLSDHRGIVDPHGYTLRASTLASADEIAGLAELVMGKVAGRPVAVVRGLRWHGQGRGASELQREAGRDLFRQ